MSGRTIPPFTVRLRAWNHLYADDAPIVTDAARRLTELEAERDRLAAALESSRLDLGSVELLRQDYLRLAAALQAVRQHPVSSLVRQIVDEALAGVGARMLLADSNWCKHP